VVFSGHFGPSGSNSPAESLPWCLNHITIDNTTITPLIPFRFGSFGYKLKATSPLHLPLPVDKPVEGIYKLQIVDYFDQVVPIEECQHYIVCIASFSPLLHVNSSIGLTCPETESFLSLPIRVDPAGAKLGRYEIRFGGDSCQFPKPTILPNPNYVVEVELISPEPFNPPNASRNRPTLASWQIALIIVGIVVLLAIIVVIVIVLLRRRTIQRYTGITTDHQMMQEPLIQPNEQTIVAEITKLLLDAEIPVVKSDEIEVTRILGAGATGEVVLGIWKSANDRQVAVKVRSFMLTYDSGNS